MRSKALVTALFIALAAPTSAFAARPTAPAAQVSPAGEHRLSRAAADARFAKREAKAHDLAKFEGGRVYVENNGGVYVAVSMTTILLVVLIILLV